MNCTLVDRTAGRSSQILRCKIEHHVRTIFAILCFVTAWSVMSSNPLLAQETPREPVAFWDEGEALLLDQKYEELNALFDLARETQQLSYGGAFMQDLLMHRIGSVTVPAERQRGALNDRLQLLLAWHDKAPSVAALTCIAQCYLNQAWNARGGGFASTINLNASSRMDTALSFAQQALIDAEELAAKLKIKDACIYQLKMQVGQLQGASPQEMLENLKKCLDINPWYLSAVNSMCQYLLPRWYGNDGDLVRFANSLYASRFKEAGMAGYAQVALAAYSNGEINRFDEGGFEWDKVKQGLLAHLEQSPESAYLLERGVFFGHIAQDRPYTREMLERLQGRFVYVNFLDVAHRERTVRWAFDDGEKGEALTVIEHGPTQVSGFSISDNDSKIVTPVRSRFLRIHDLVSGERIKELDFWPESIVTVARHEVQGKTDVMIASEGVVELRRYDFKDLDYEVLGTSAPGVQQVVTSQDGTGVAIVDRANSIKFWQIKDRALPFEWAKVSEARVNALAISSDGSLIAANDKRAIKLWDTRKRELIHSWDSQSNLVMGLVFSSDGKTLFSTGHGGELRMWSTTDFSELGKVSTDMQWGMSLDVTSDGKYAVVGAYDDREIPQPGYVFIIDMASKTIVKKILAHRTQMLSVAITSDDSKVVTAGNDASVRVWSMP